MSIAQAQALEQGQEVHAELVALVNKDNDIVPYALVWRVSVYPKDSRGTEMIIDAHEGVVLRKYPMGDDYRNSGDVDFHYYVDSIGYDNPTSLGILPENPLSENMTVQIFSSALNLVAQQTVYSSNPRYDIWWSGASGPHLFYFYKDGSHAKVFHEFWAYPQSSMEYDIGSPKSPPTGPILDGGVASRDILNGYYHCNQTHAFFQAIDNAYSKPKVYVTLTYSAQGNPGTAESRTQITLVDYGGESPDAIHHEYSHTVVFDVYGNDYGVGQSDEHEKQTMDEAFADFFAAYSFADRYFRDPYTTYDLEDPGNYSGWGAPYPSHYSQHSTSKDVHWNAAILSSALWDLVQGGNPNSPPPSPPHPTGWDEIVWLALNDEKTTHHDFRNRVIYWAGAWGGSSYSNFATSIFNEHGIPSSGSW